MVVEVKKLVGESMISLEAADILELLIYCHYTLHTSKQHALQGVLTDSLNWHCFDLRLQGSNSLMDLTRYICISFDNENETIGTLPSLLSE